MILEKKRVHFVLFLLGVVAISFTAEKCRELVGKEAASKSGEFTLLNCFDGSSGTAACLVKEGVKLYSYSIRSFHVEGARNKAIEAALADAISQGMAAQEAAKLAQREGAKAAKLATRKVKRIVGPIIASGWDFFEALYYGGTMTEGFLRGTGTLFGTYYIGYLGEERFGRVGYFVGSQLGSWVGGRVGLMVYDVVSGVHFLLQVSESVESKIQDNLTDETYETPEDSFVPETPEAPEDSSYNSEGSSETTEDSADAPEDLSALETPDMSSESPEETIVDEFSGAENTENYEEL